MPFSTVCTKNPIYKHSQEFLVLYKLFLEQLHQPIACLCSLVNVISDYSNLL